MDGAGGVRPAGSHCEGGLDVGACVYSIPALCEDKGESKVNLGY